MNGKEKIIGLLKDSIQVTTYDNGEFIECEVNFLEVAEHLTENGVVILKCGAWERVSLDDQYEGCYMCTACREEMFFWDDDPIAHYCPNCGAKMIENHCNNL